MHKQMEYQINNAIFVYPQYSLQVYKCKCSHGLLNPHNVKPEQTLISWLCHLILFTFDYLVFFTPKWRKLSIAALISYS